MFGNADVVPNVDLPDYGLDWQGDSFFQQGYDRDACEDRVVVQHYGHLGLFFGVFDGHGGGEVATHLANFFHQRFFDYLNDLGHPESESLAALIEAHFNLVEETKDHFCGACGAVGFLMKNRRLAWANLGDCRILIVGSDGYRRLTHDHNFLDMDEVARVQGLGGDIGCNRLHVDCGSLNISRAYGDKSFYPFLSTVPANGLVRVRHEDKAIVAFSDGISCRLPDEQVAKMSLVHKPVGELAKQIAHKAVSEGSPDDVSCVVIRF